ncbi:MAG TPA: fused MFS/spermidine synthase [Burkholderiales bacterium]|jgi:spermidine synthase|nr:fused MFS/spermidine synthase [Burkholderiales bacterium]
MSDFSALPSDIPSSASEQHEVLVEEYAGMRLMSFDGDRLQSAMKVSRPHELAVAYTQRMMSFLLFHPAPKRIVMIGLGGGSLAKFIHHAMPDTSTTIVEVDPRVLATARSHFHLPQDDDRLHVVIAEGSQYVATHRDHCDILIVDGFDSNGQAPSLCTPSFYDDCYAALRPGGMLVVNLFNFGKTVDVFLNRIRARFGGTVLTSSSSRDDNCVVFGFRDESTLLADSKLIERAEALKDRYELPFPRFVQKMKYMS